MLLPIRSKNPPDSRPYATVALIIANVATYIGTTDGFDISHKTLERLAVSGDHYTLVRSFNSLFLHGNLEYLLGNMWFLYLFGFPVEGRLRTPKFLALYFLAGFGGDVLHQLILGASEPGIYSLGASGAIMGVLGAALYIFPFSKIDCVAGFFYAWKFTLDMWMVGVLYFGLDIFEAYRYGGQDGIGHFAHIGGALTGMIFCLATFVKRDSKSASDAKVTLHETGDHDFLSSDEMASMAKANPQGTELVLNWMSKSLSEGHISPECQKAFELALPQIIRREDLHHVGSVLLSLSQTPGTVPGNFLLQLSARLEAKGEPTLALNLLDSAMRIPKLPDSVFESAMFRSAVICEKLRRPELAVLRYEEVIRNFPVSPLADQAKMRVQVLASKAP